MAWSRGMPIMTADRHARIANIERSLGSLMWAAGASARRVTSSWTSEGPKTVCFEKGRDSRRSRCMGGALASTAIWKPLALKTCMWSMTISSSAALKCRGRGAIRRWEWISVPAWVRVRVRMRVRVRVRVRARVRGESEGEGEGEG